MADNSDAPLPKGWSRGYSRSQQRFYYSHAETKHTQWHFPTASEATDPRKAKKRADENQERERKRSHESSSNSNSINSNSNNKKPASTVPVKRQRVTTDPDAFLALADTTCVAIIVPYRDIHASQKRAAHLAKFIPHMNAFLGKLVQQGRVSDYHIYIVEQSDDKRKFNRGKLLNIGL
jgi:hypothetical protein